MSLKAVPEQALDEDVIAIVNAGGDIALPYGVKVQALDRTPDELKEAIRGYYVPGYVRRIAIEIEILE